MTPSDDVPVELRGHDLNLFVVFLALIEERNVTRTAERLRMSQAAVSAALARLRKMHDDPLFVRASHGVEPTVKALRLVDPVREGLGRLRVAIAGEPVFDPIVDPMEFRVAMSDDLEALLLPAMIRGVIAASPGSSVFCVQANRMTMVDLLESGTIQLGVAASSSWGPGIRSATLFESGYACVYDREALGRVGALTFEEYLAVDHLMVSADATRGIVDDVLAESGHRRRRVASTAHFAMVPLLLSGLAAVATIPRHAAEVFATMSGLEVTTPPIDLPRFGVSMVWHGSDDNDPRIAWLREQTRSSAECMRANNLDLSGGPA